jgi:ferric-dicitrate binding protein FerR (iron transport regulator)
MREYLTGELRAAAIFIRSRNWQGSGRQAIALLIATAILCLYAPVGSAAPKLNSKSAIGAITAEGVVQINGSPVLSGQTLFSGSSIRTSPETECTLELGNLARLKLEAETSLMLESSKLGLSASLDNGVVRALVPGGVPAGINTGDASITTDANQTASFSVRVDSCSTTLSVQAGRVEIRSANYERSVAAGESFSTGVAQLSTGGQHYLSNRKKVGLLIGIGGAIVILLIALRGETPVNETTFGGSVANPSPR